MSAWYSNILTTTTSQISSISSKLLSSDADGDTEDDTHVCRVLRAYYTEQGRPFPPWLPPDPKAPPPVQPALVPPANTVGSRYGGLSSSTSSGGSGSLSSLWDNNNSGASGGTQGPQSLRQGRGNPPPPRGGDSWANNARQRPFARTGAGTDDGGVQARPLPSQRAGSYQTAGLYGNNQSGSAGGTPPSSASTGGASDRLKQRLWGGRSTSPAQQSAYPPPPQQQQSGGGGGWGGSDRRGGYGGGGGGGGGGEYEDRFAPGGMYDGGYGGGSGSGGRSGGSDRPFVAANAPWTTSADEFAYGSRGGGSGKGGGGGGGGGGQRRAGLPSGPRMR